MGGRRVHQRHGGGHLHIGPGVVPGTLRVRPLARVRSVPTRVHLPVYRLLILYEAVRVTYCVRRRYILREPDAAAGVRDDAGPAAGPVRVAHGRAAVPAGALRGGVLGGRYTRRAR